MALLREFIVNIYEQNEPAYSTSGEQDKIISLCG